MFDYNKFSLDGYLKHAVLNYTSFDFPKCFNAKIESKEFKKLKTILSFFHLKSSVSTSSIPKVLKIQMFAVNVDIKRYMWALTVDRAQRLGQCVAKTNKNLTQKALKSFKINLGLLDNDRTMKYQTSRSNLRNIRFWAALKFQ